MKNILLLIILVINFKNAVSQSIFKVVETKTSCLNCGDSTQEKLGPYYRIVLCADSPFISPSYPLLTESSHIDTVKAIGELLALKGNKRICALPIMSYNPLSSQIYMGTNRIYSIQVEALFIINQLILEKPFFYSSYPILVDRSDNSEASVSGYIIDKAFQAYSNWYKSLKKIGMQKVSKSMPLDGTSIRWY